MRSATRSASPSHVAPARVPREVVQHAAHDVGRVAAPRVAARDRRPVVDVARLVVGEHVLDERIHADRRENAPRHRVEETLGDLAVGAIGDERAVHPLDLFPASRRP